MPLKRLLAWFGVGLVAVLLAIAGTLLLFGDTLLNRYGRGRIERAVAAAHPGWVLRLGDLGYAAGANRLIAQSVALQTTTVMLQTGRVSLTGVPWARVVRGKASLAAALSAARLEATNLSLEFPRANYGVRCARLQAWVPGAELIAEAVELQPLVGDEDFFAASEFRMTRFRVVVPGCRVSGLDFGSLLPGKSYRARSVEIVRPSFEALVNRDKPVKPFVRSPLMAHEALRSIREPLRVDHLSITNGRLTYSERMRLDAEPAVLSFGGVRASATGIANGDEATAALRIDAQGELMDAGTLKVLMTIPANAADLSLHYSGSLASMDLTLLNRYTGPAQHIRIRSGTADAASFNIQVLAGRARGKVQASYRGLQVAVLDRQTGSANAVDDLISSFLANVFKVRTSSGGGGSGELREGQVDYARVPEEQFMEFVWSALWSGVRDAITH